MVRRLDRMQREKGERLVVFLAAPPATGKSTLAAFLAGLSQKLSCMPVQAVGLDGFHYHQDYILTHSVTFQDGRTLPMKQLKGSPETYDVVHFQEKLEALRHSDPLWPVYDRRFHDVIEDQLPVTAPIVLIEGNWLLFQEGLWRKLAGQADYTIFIKAEERALKERLLQRKMTGGSTREEAEAFYRGWRQCAPISARQRPGRFFYVHGGRRKLFPLLKLQNRIFSGISVIFLLFRSCRAICSQGS